MWLASLYGPKIQKSPSKISKTPIFLRGLQIIEWFIQTGNCKTKLFLVYFSPSFINAGKLYYSTVYCWGIYCSPYTGSCIIMILLLCNALNIAHFKLISAQQLALDSVRSKKIIPIKAKSLHFLSFNVKIVQTSYKQK